MALLNRVHRPYRPVPTTSLSASTYVLEVRGANVVGVRGQLFRCAECRPVPVPAAMWLFGTQLAIDFGASPRSLSCIKRSIQLKDELLRLSLNCQY